MKFSKQFSAWLTAIAAAATVLAADQTLPDAYRIPATVVVAIVASLLAPKTKP